jgi:riboflavin synthase
MFTGLVQATGAIVSVVRRDGGVHIDIDAAGLAPRPIRVGDSIAVSGVCLTATAVTGGRFSADVSDETLSKTCGLDRCRAVNLETSLALGDTLGGHLVSGHVDGIGAVRRCDRAGESVELVILAPPPLARFLAVKGSVCIDGVSLTVNRVHDHRDAAPGAVHGCEFSINLIPHTLAVTTLKDLAPGSSVNLEIDLIARYVGRMLEASTANPGAY